ncbi:MAG: hypothetical protein H7039_00490 [Bryobacteraceae bacterium]|nr:hypothetical protein [Bryobacteraceae bacterium]
MENARPAVSLQPQSDGQSYLFVRLFAAKERQETSGIRDAKLLREAMVPSARILR